MSIQLVQSGFTDNDSSGTVTLGDQLDFTTTATNTGGVTLTNVHITDTFNATGTTCASIATGGTCTLTSSHIVTSADVAAGQVVDIATATSNQLPPQTTGGGSSTGPGSATLAAALTSNADGDGSGTVTVGDVLTYTFTATNTGTTGLTNAVVAITSAGTFTPNLTTCASVAVGATCVLTTNHTVTATDAANSTINAAADIVATEIATPVQANVITPVAPVVVPPALTIVSGNNQVLPVNTASVPMVVLLTNNGVPVANATITWSTAGNATLAALTSLTNAAGKATNTVTLHQAGAASVSASSSAPAAGPVTFALNGGLASLSGLTPPEVEVANSLDHACPALAGLTSLTPAEQDLLTQCQALASAAGQHPGQVANALNQMLPHDALLQTNASILVASAQFDNIKARMAALRSGNGGDHFGGLAFSSPDGVLPIGKLGENALGFADQPADKKTEVGSDFSRWGFFLTGTFGSGSSDPRQETPGYGFHSGGITAGVDYRFNDHVIGGISAGYANYASNVDFVGGGLDTRGWSLSAYSTFFRQDNWYVDGVLTWGHNDYDINRRIIYALSTNTGTVSVNQAATSSSSGTTLAGAVTLGRDFSSGSLSYGPYLRGTWTRTDFGAYQETLLSNQSGSGLGLSVASRSMSNTATVLGGKLNSAVSTSWGVLMPHAEIEWEHDFQNNPDSLTASFLQDPTATPFHLVGDSIDTDFFRLGLGMSFQFAHGRSGFIYYERTLGLSGITQDSIALGFRMEF